MLTKDQIATVYSNARELVKQNNPKAARQYVLLLLNNAVNTYQNASSALLKAKTAVFLDRWIAVSKDLYDFGVTKYVLQCFSLDVSQNISPDKPLRQEISPPGSNDSETVDIAGLIDERGAEQGWCAEVFEMNKKAVVQINVSAAAKIASGTGFIISDEGYLLTDDHIIFNNESGAYYPKITMNLCGEHKKIKLEVLFSDKKSDLALCKFNMDEVGKFVSVKRIADYSALLQGADCLVIGNAFGMGLAPFSGVVRFTKDSDGNLVYTAPSNPGDSGGPVFNRKGECIGINKSKTVKVNETAADAYANATPMDTIEDFLKKWTSNNGIKL